MASGVPLDTATAQDLIRKLVADREAYLESVKTTHQLLIAALAQSAAAPSQPTITEAARRTTTASLEVESIQRDRITGSTFTGDDSEEEESASIFVQVPLAPDVYSLEGFRTHLRAHKWTDSDFQIIGPLLKDDSVLSSPSLFPVEPGPADDRSHLSHYSIFDVGADGAPLEIRLVGGKDKDTSRAMAIWNRLKSTNEDPNRESPAVGRITIVREPSPLLFAALHYTMNEHFDVDELFQFLVDDDPGLAHPHRAFSDDHRRQRSFVFTMEYFTIIGKGCKPMTWQMADEEGGPNQTHIAISRCSSVVALSLSGKPIAEVRNKDRRVERKFGNVYDPFAPWRVLSIQAYPDLRHSVDSHDSTKHYLNGPEAFLVTLRAEFRDARKRLYAVYDSISELVEPPANFMFHQATRDRLLFEDENFTYSRRYFWAYQSLGIMNQDIHEMVTTYRETFKESVWDGSNKIIWPGAATTSSRHAAWRKRMNVLRKDLEHEMTKLTEIEALNDQKMKEVKGLRDNLFSGTSVYESRQSVQNSRITVKQGRNIRLLTLVTIFFLPLTFVTSVFGMTPIDAKQGFKHFGYTIFAICLPTYLIIGSLNTPSGLEFWSKRYDRLSIFLGNSGARFLDYAFNYRPIWTRAYHQRHSAADPSEFSSQRKRRPGRLDRAHSENGFNTGIEMRGTFGGMPQLSPRETIENTNARGMFGRGVPPLSPRDTTTTFENARGSGTTLARPPTSLPSSPVRMQHMPTYPPSPRNDAVRWQHDVDHTPRTPATPTSPAMDMPRVGSPLELRGTMEDKLDGDSESTTGDAAAGAQEEREGSILSRLFRRKGRRRSEAAGRDEP